MTTRFRIALLVAMLAAASGCGKGRSGAAGDSCEAVGEHYLGVARAEITRTEGEDKKNAEAMLSLLPKLETQLISECNRDKWSVEARKCMLAASSAAAAQGCAKLLGKSAAGDDPVTKTTPAPGPTAPIPADPTPPSADPTPSQPDPAADDGAM